VKVEAVVWVGSYGNPSPERSYICVRWTADEAMSAMQEDYSRTGGGRLEFGQVHIDEDVGYAPGLDRWEADISRIMDDGHFNNEWVYVEPFLVPAEGPPVRYIQRGPEA
jgi:hypothetical protein